jgi:6-phosphogluconolactonase
MQNPSSQKTETTGCLFPQNNNMIKDSNPTVFPNVPALNQAAAAFILASAKEAVTKKGVFYLVLSGGETPNAIYALLAEPPFLEEMPWQQIVVFWGDERCVPVDDKNNNAHTARQVLLDKVPVPKANIFPIPVNLPAEDAAKNYENTINSFLKVQPYFDLVMLGLGENGHTASLFPHTPVLLENTSGVRPVLDAEGGLMRISMTAPLLNLGRQILFVVKGKNKAATLSKVLDGPFLPEDYPAQLIQPVNGTLNWFVDISAITLCC